MTRLHIFNPSHDEALAANSPFYYPARAARMLGADLAVLPAWWAQPGDGVLLPDEVDLPKEDFTGRGVHFVHSADLRNSEMAAIQQILPWGWDPLLVHQLRKAGIPERLLPDLQRLQHIRQLSSRHTAVHLLEAVHQDFPNTVGTSFWCTDLEEVTRLISRHGQLMLKAPWSSSGRGVFAVGENMPDPVRSRIQRILKEQGAIEAEPFYQRISDFALEFYAHPDEVSYEGLSVFATSENGAYLGNRVDQEEQLFLQLPTAIGQPLREVIDSLRFHLHRLLDRNYEGPLGVDLMSVSREDGSLALHPCVEINLRRTMGHVALALREALTAGQTAVYSLRPMVPEEEAAIRRLTPGAQKMEAVLRLL